MNGRQGYTAHDAAILASLFALAAVSRGILADPMLFNMDAGHFAFALERFDVTLHQPHPPGYFLFVMLGRVTRLFTQDANAALVAVSASMSALTACMAFVVARRMYGRVEGVAAGLFALTSPLGWFYGLVGLSYTSECFMAALGGYACYRAWKRDPGWLWVSAAILGVAGGFRQTTTLFLLPLWFYCAWGYGAARIAAACAVMAVAFAAWFLPMLHATGGYAAYKAANQAIFDRTVWRGVTIPYMLENAGIQFTGTAWGLGAAVVPLAALAVFAARERDGSANTSNSWFYLLWVAPAVLFYVVVISREFSPGYSLAFMPGLFVLAGYAAVRVSDMMDGAMKPDSAARGRIWSVIAGSVAALNILMFSRSDFSYSPRTITANNNVMNVYLKGLDEHFSPDNTILVSWEHIFAGFRQAAYYRPDYAAYFVPALLGPDGEYYLECHDRKTRAVPDVEAGPGTIYMVYFAPVRLPLPDRAKELGAKALDIGGGFGLVYFERDDIPHGKDAVSGLIMKLNGILY